MTKEEWTEKKKILKAEKEQYNKEIEEIMKTLDPLNYMFKTWHGSKNHFSNSQDAKKYFDKFCNEESVRTRMRYDAERIHKDRKILSKFI